MTDTINIGIPTWDFFKKHETQINDREVYICYYSPYGPFANFEKMFAENQFIDADTKIRLAIIDEEFENLWKENKTTEENNEFISEHIGSLSDDEFVKMFNKHNLKEGYRLNLLGFRMYFDDNPYEYQNYVSDETYNKLCQYFEGVFGKENVYIKNQLMIAPDICNNLTALYEEMIGCMKDGAKPKLSHKIVKTKLPYADIYLPVMTKYTVKNPLMNIDDFQYDAEKQKLNTCFLSCLIGFEDKALEFYGVETKTTFSESDAHKGILKDLKNRTELMFNQFIPDYYLPEHYELQVAEWNRFVEKQPKK